jgi:hypothetical protein
MSHWRTGARIALEHVIALEPLGRASAPVALRRYPVARHILETVNSMIARSKTNSNRAGNLAYLMAA